MTPNQKQRLKPLLKKLVMEVKNELKEENTYFSKQKVQKLIADIVQFQKDTQGDASIMRYAPNAANSSLKTSKIFLSSLKTLLDQL